MKTTPRNRSVTPSSSHTRTAPHAAPNCGRNTVTGKGPLVCSYGWWSHRCIWLGTAGYRCSIHKEEQCGGEAIAICKVREGEAFCNTIVTSLRDAGLDTLNSRAQTCDGADNMADNKNGVAAKFNEIAGYNVLYTHCASHDLNLVLCRACKVPAILCMIEKVRQLGKFFSYPKRMQVLEDAMKQYHSATWSRRMRSELSSSRHCVLHGGWRNIKSWRTCIGCMNPL